MSLPTVRAAMASAAQTLARAEVADPAADVRRLMAAVLGVDGARLSLMQDEPLTPDQRAQFDAFQALRARRQPVAQIIGRRAFWRHDFQVTPDTLDPRPETESLVAAALELPWRTVLDLGTGTGAILISLLSERPGARGMGVDLSPAALDVARANAARIGVRADFAASDWFTAVPDRFDLIVSNPPYIAVAEMADLSPEVRDWEPHLALTDGGDGLSAYRVIADGAAAHLTPGGTVLCEIGHEQGPAVSKIFVAAGAVVRVRSDLDGRDRVICATFAA